MGHPTMKRVLKTIALMIALPIFGVSASGAILRDVRVLGEGPGQIDESYVRAHIVVKPGDELEPTAVSRDVKDLLATGRYSNVRAELDGGEDGMTLTYVVRRKIRVVETVEIEGGKHLGQDKIRKLLDLGPGDLVDDPTLAVRGQELSREYRENGFKDASINWLMKDLDEEDGTALVNVDVEEGGVTKIRATEFVGNESISGLKLKKRTSRKKWWNPFSWLGWRLYNPDEVIEDVALIRAEYLERGFLDVKVGTPELVPLKSGNYQLRFTIDEGIPYTVGSTEVEGIASFPETELLKRISLQDAAPLSLFEVRKDAERIRDYYTSRGYLRTQVKPLLLSRSDEEGGRGVVDIVFQVSEGSLISVRNVFISGNTITKEVVIRRELAIFPGDVFDEPSIRKSESALRNLGYFSHVTSRPQPTPKLDELDLIFNVEEQRTGKFMIGGGFSSIDDLVGFIEITEGNFDIGSWPPKGAGQKLKLRAQFGSKMNSSELSFVEPWFLGRRLRLGLDLFATDRDYDDYDVRRKGIGIRIGKQVNMPFFEQMELGYRIEDVVISDVADTNEYTRLTGSRAGDPYYFIYTNELRSGVSLSLTRDRRNSYFFPSAGHRVVLNAEVSGGMLGGDTEIYGWGLRGEKYIPLWHNHVLAIKARTEVVEELNDDREMSIFDRLFVGGGNTIRGFDYRGVGPKAMREYETSESETATIFRSIGGRTLLMANIEYVVPLVDKVHIAGFCDAGNVAEDANDFGFSTMATSAGVELRLQVPQFPIRINYAWSLSKDDELTGEHPWGFWVGPSF